MSSQKRHIPLETWALRNDDSSQLENLDRKETYSCACREIWRTTNASFLTFKEEILREVKEDKTNLNLSPLSLSLIHNLPRLFPHSFRLLQRASFTSKKVSSQAASLLSNGPLSSPLSPQPSQHRSETSPASYLSLPLHLSSWTREEKIQTTQSFSTPVECQFAILNFSASSLAYHNLHVPSISSSANVFIPLRSSLRLFYLFAFER